jgi:thioester reductase-like protein
VQLSRATANVSADQLRKRTAQAVDQDKELVIDPEFFWCLPGNLPGISAAEVHLKRGRSANELTRHRYDVVLRVGDPLDPRPICDTISWESAGGSLERLEGALSQRRWRAIRLEGASNQRLAKEAIALGLIDTSDDQIDARTLRAQVDSLPAEGVDPERVYEIAEANGYEVALCPAATNRFDIWVVDPARCKERVRMAPPAVGANAWHSYANDPTANATRQHLIPQLRDFLKMRLPGYMVPSAWVVLKQLPLTSHGKVDKHALPDPQGRHQEIGEYFPPRSDIERTLADIWIQLLPVDRVGVRDDFFELGGHSLLALRVLLKINERFGSTLRVLDFYQSPTVEALANRIQGATPAEDLVDLAKEAALSNEIVGNSSSPRTPPLAVMLTGGTGFVGRFLLAQLLKESDATIYCLIRARSVQHALSRIKANLLTWDLWRNEFENRIVPVPGDLGQPCLGIDNSTYQQISRQVDSIYHCGVSMNHLEPYTMAKAANVDACKEILRFACCHTPKLVNYISTLGVFSAYGTDAPRIVTERSPIDQEKHLTSYGYTASKWVGEKVFMLGCEKGIPCNIFRLGLIWADTQQGRYDELQAGYRIMKTCLLSGYGIRSYSFELPPTPVDYVARAVTLLTRRYNYGQGIFHISSSKQSVDGLFERCNALANTALKLLPFYEWTREIKRLHEKGRTLPAVPLIEFTFSMEKEELTNFLKASRPFEIQFDCTRTNQELETAGAIAPIVDDESLKLSLKSMFSSDRGLREHVGRGTSYKTRSQHRPT